MARESLHVALLRGINVGGKNKLPMKDLCALASAAGCAEVRSYIQSGNLVFRIAPALGERVAGLIGAAVEKRFGFRPPVVIRSAAELRKVSADNPFLGAGADPTTLHVAFLADRPSAAQVAALDPNRSPPDRFTVRDREIYLTCPNGLGRSKLTNAYFDAKLATVSTLRNWRTVLELIELSR